MRLFKTTACIAGLFAGMIFIQSCSSYDPVSVKDCKKVVMHAQKILGDFAPKRSEMMADCKKATDSERGCVMAATKKGQVAQCM